MHLEPLKLKQDGNKVELNVHHDGSSGKSKGPLFAALFSLPFPPDNLNLEEWNKLHECISILKPVEQLTVIISGKQYPTFSCVISLIRSL